MNLDFMKFYEADDGQGEGTGTKDGEQNKEEVKAFKTFANEEEYNKAIKSERSKAKKEVMDELGIKTLDEAKNQLTQTATLQNKLSETETKLQTIEQNYALDKFGVKDEFKEEALTLAKAKITEEINFEAALKQTIEKMPFVTGKPFQGKIGQEQNNNNNDQSVDQKISNKYPWIKG